MTPSLDGSAAAVPIRAQEQGVSGAGEMAALIRARNWAATPLGAMEGWSPTLKTVVDFLVANRFPLLLWWGPDYISIYNDAYRPILGNKHPAALGLPVRECWSEIWHVLKPLIDTPFAGGPATWMDDLPLEINRHGFVEETHFTVAYSPVPDETAPHGIGGVLATVHEVTEKVVGERRVMALRDLGLRATEGRTAEAACAIAAEALAGYARDIPFALLYLIDPDARQARLCGAVGIGMGEAASPMTIDLAEAGSPAVWPLAEAVRTEALVTIGKLNERLGHVPPGPWSDPPHQAVIVPIRSNREHVLAGLLVAGVSPRLGLDNLYRSFFELVATQIATAIANARAYEEERRRAEALAEIDRAKTAFFSNVSHEFRTPLTLLLGPLEDALNDNSPPKLPAPQRERLEVAHRNGVRLLRLVNTLLDFSRIEAGRAQARYQPTDLAVLTADLASVFRSIVERAGLFLKIDCPPLPEPVLIDREMWEKVVLNLLSNAFKFTFAGGVTVTLRVGGGHAAMTVADTGVGIPRDELPRVFERFHRIEGQKSRSFEGSGIGLALVHDLVRLQGGTISATSEPGTGSAFTVTIPFGTAHLQQDRIESETATSATATHAEAFVEEALRWLPDPDTGREQAQAGASGARPRVLLADDNADMRAYVRRLLRDRYDVTAVADGQAALDAIRRQLPDLVLADVMMPVLDGFGLLRAIRADPALRDVPVVLLSARAGEEARAEGLDAGADDYLTKPFSARELVARLGANLAMARVRQEATQAAQDHAERLRQMFEQAPGFMCVLRGPDHQFELTNAAFLRLAGNRDVIGRTVREAFPEVENQGFFELLDEVWHSGEALTGQGMRIVLRRAEDEARDEKFVDFVYQPIKERDGTVTGIFVEGSDVTERVRAEAALRATKEQLEAHVAQRTAELHQTVDQLHGEVLEREQAEEALRHAQKMEAIGQLTGGIAHDFNNMLQAILGGLEIAQRRIADGRPAEAGRFMDAARQAAEGAAGLTRRLLAFARRQQLDPRAVDPDALVSSLVDLIRRTVGPGVDVGLRLSADATAVWCDPSGLESALLNLCINARDAMPSGGRLTLGTRRKRLTGWDVVGQEGAAPGDYVAITVADTGEGMPAEVMARAFEPFFTTKPQGQGTGLGLSQVFGFVRQSGGLVRLESTPGQGTVVELCLPAHDKPAAEQPQAKQATSGNAVAGRTVLLVDDGDAIRELAAGQLRELGHTVLEAADGPAALRLLDGGAAIDLLITDIGLPRGMNGRQLAEAVRERRPGLPVLFITGYAGTALPPGIGVIGKPFALEALTRRVQEILSARP